MSQESLDQLSAGHARAYAAGQALEREGSDWAAVCYFYAAYSAVRFAFCADSRLDSDASSRAVNAKLGVGSRHVTHHNGHPNRGPGVNDIVRMLYPEIGSKYQLLHVKSNEVRYGAGLVGVSVAEVRGLLEEVLSHLAEKQVFPKAKDLVI